MAYIDPGAGSMLFQLLVAGLLGALFALRTLRARIVGLFRAGAVGPGDACKGTETAVQQEHSASASAADDDSVNARSAD